MKNAMVSMHCLYVLRLDLARTACARATTVQTQARRTRMNGWILFDGQPWMCHVDGSHTISLIVAVALRTKNFRSVFFIALFTADHILELSQKMIATLWSHRIPVLSLIRCLVSD
jgi:hypothetical protein